MKFYAVYDEMHTTIEKTNDDEGITITEAKQEAIEYLQMIILDCKQQIKRVKSLRIKHFNN